jgi:hypothetical protein
LLVGEVVGRMSARSLFTWCVIIAHASKSNKFPNFYWILWNHTYNRVLRLGITAPLLYSPLFLWEIQSYTQRVTWSCKDDFTCVFYGCSLATSKIIFLCPLFLSGDFHSPYQCSRSQAWYIFGLDMALESYQVSNAHSSGFPEYAEQNLAKSKSEEPISRWSDGIHADHWHKCPSCKLRSFVQWSRPMHDSVLVTIWTI